MSDIQTKIKQNRDLGKNIEDILSQLEIPDNNQKALLFIAFIRNGLSHFCSMNLLIEQNLYHSSFAFVRVFFDNILNSIKDLGYSNQLAITTSTMTTMNIVTQNTRK